MARAIGALFGGFGIGLRLEEELYSAGIFLNPTGLHRLGAVVDLNDPDGEDNNITSYDLGFSFVHQGFTFSIDDSKRDYEGAEVDDNTWWGFGYGSDQDWSIGFYHDYVNEWTVVGSLYY